MFTPQVAVTKETVTVTELRVKELVEDNEYTFRVTAHNLAGPSKPSLPSEPFTARDPWSMYFI